MKKIAPKGSSAAFLHANVSSTSQDCIIWPYRPNASGYGLAVIDGKQGIASRMMCVLAHGQPVSPRIYAAHKCGNPTCVNPNHLYWATHSENMADRKKHGTEIYGERNGKTWLTESDVRAIREAPPNLKPLMERYGLSKHAVAKIRSGKRWGHIA